MSTVTVPYATRSYFEYVTLVCGNLSGPHCPVPDRRSCPVRGPAGVA